MTEVAMKPAEDGNDVRQFRNFPCTRCENGALLVLDSREIQDRGVRGLRRRRACDRCGHKLTTYETSTITPRRLRAMITAAEALDTQMSKFFAVFRAGDSDNG